VEARLLRERTQAVGSIEAGEGPSDLAIAHRGSLRRLVLAALVERPAHGYDLTNRLNRRMGAMLQTDSRRVYEVLEALEKEGLASSVEEQAAAAPHRRRRVYSPTEAGRSARSGWLGERQPLPLGSADIHALVAFSDPSEAPQVLERLEEYELDCMEMQERTTEENLERASWTSRMIGVTRAAVSEQLQAELRWITRVRREIEEYLAQAQ
jgi:DNA-binding PadR family transcriptional regulator